MTNLSSKKYIYVHYIIGGYMYITNNNINFRAHIRNTQELQTGFSFARQELRAGNPNYGNYLANSINLFANDNTNDVYEVTTDTEEDGGYVLRKNGKPVYSRNFDSPGESVVFLLADKAMINYNQSIVSPLPEGFDRHSKCKFVRDKLKHAESLLEN